ncbi:Secreted RxLR effector peptide protein [Phytophthora palmivora]|uniref:RxLR effector protein n=1 Tax=Phytophthora palmivora TaxID=4796 RepID=A0A2P4XJS6_9STRA|nr:Secreted RxLR effector peptide protein [Phytophthora palmivora]
MRLTYAVLATVVTLLASSHSSVTATNSEQTKLMAAESPLLTHSLTAEQSVGTNKRSLRAVDDSLAADEDIGESSMMEKAKFYYWYTMGRTPGYVYQDFFEGVDENIVVNNPAYKEWKRYKAYYEEKKGK